MKFYGTEIRFLNEDHSRTNREYLHEDYELTFPYQTYEEASAFLETHLQERLADYLDDEMPGSPNIHCKIAEHYPIDQGGGFWFEATVDEVEYEGRAIVVTANCGREE
jgi:hypothetical protein